MIHFFSEDITYSLADEAEIRRWLTEISRLESKEIEELNYIFCSDNYLHTINLQYLNHDTFTDIITFDHRDSNEEPIIGDVFISIDRVTENAQQHNASFEDERDRVIAHGLLHLLGFDDKSEESKDVMRKKEDACLSLR